MQGTILPNDCSHHEMLNEVVQQEPAGSTDPELMGSIAAIGIVTRSGRLCCAARSNPRFVDFWRRLPAIPSSRIAVTVSSSTIP